MRILWAGLLATGCTVELGGTEVDPDAPTWHGEVAPLVAQRCAGCHQIGGIGGFSLTTYEAAAGLAPALADAVSSGRMPPWPAAESAECTPRHGWQRDLRLTPAEIGMFEAWSAAGAPEGVAAPPPPIPNTAALPDASATLRPTTPFTVEGAQDQYMCFSLDPELAETVWVTGVQVVPDDAEVVHHALIYADPTGASAVYGEEPWPCFGGAGVAGAQLIQPWTPGQLPYETPDGVGFPVDPGARFIVSMHYHPVPGEARPDATGLDVRWSTTETPVRGFTTLIGNGRGLQSGPSDASTSPSSAFPRAQLTIPRPSSSTRQIRGWPSGCSRSGDTCTGWAPRSTSGSSATKDRSVCCTFPPGTSSGR